MNNDFLTTWLKETEDVLPGFTDTFRALEAETKGMTKDEMLAYIKRALDPSVEDSK